MMALDETPPTQKPVRGCQTFANSWLPTHLTVYAGGVALWTAVYLAVVLGSGTPRLFAAETADGLFLRRFGTGIAGVATGLYFTVAYTRALGAPLPNLIAASAISALMPVRVLALGNTPPSPALVGSDLLVPTLVLSGGSVVTLGVVIGWYYVRFSGTGTAGAERWESDYFPRGFRLAVSATESGTIDWNQARYGFGEWSYWRFFRNGATVFAGGLLLYGIVLAGQVMAGELIILQALEETPWVLLALAGAVYIWWTNYQWRAKQSK